MMKCKTWDIVLVPFPFTNLQTTKKRPALIISPDNYNKGPDFIILFITSNVKSFGRTGDTIIKKWKESGLPNPSMIRMKFATLERSMILKKIGNLNNTDRERVRKTILDFFDG
ncbi:type II toxin-antitoxin system PemK/MazF family toxin [Rhodohalobacter sulfatireducens]|uniref:Type II toxin-antitoxin system PemK/MazF family toxin n=1 Tax=Rhodohalobacter sulfatireducens TaxID=2911366 RepID=A0ABS9KBJ3_9BACT|nr:type II toxin-antitoxin system PemK/MazF family toxin [Rhodohalobacter sulfatireducens]MCG2588227.1 type II toxin-antitoxin system PemK/MazF family toxin [Rhodohalobacter sulfatireducens]